MPDRSRRYGVWNSWMVADTEIPLADAMTAGRWGDRYSSQTEDWLAAQHLMNRLLTRAVNGVSDFSPGDPRQWLYLFIYGSPDWWRGSLRSSSGFPSQSLPCGPITTRLMRHVSGPRVGLQALQEMFLEAEEALDRVPSELTTRQVVKHVRREPPPGAAIHRRMRMDLEALQGSSSVYLHGSMATGDSTAFSDVDDLVIVHRDAWSSFAEFKRVVKTLERSAVRFQAADPLQHHGHWVYSDLDLRCLDESVMPLSVLDDGIVVIGEDKVHATVRSDQRYRYQIVWNLAQQVRREALALEAGSLDAYRLKALASSVALLPALIAQVAGSTISKKEAIDTCHTFLSAEACSAVRWTTALRQTWPYANGARARLSRVIMRLLPARRPALERLGRLLAPRVSRAVVARDTETIDAIFQLTDEAIGALQEAIAPAKSLEEQ